MIETTLTSISYTADGSQTQWDFPYAYLQASDIKLYVTVSGGTRTKVESGYSFDTTTNKMTYPTEGDPVAAGTVVELVRETAQTQLEDSSVANFKSDDVERIADKLTLVCQELQRQINELKDLED